MDIDDLLAKNVRVGVTGFNERCRYHASNHLRARPVSKKALRTVVKTLRDVARDLDNGDCIQAKKERENFERILDCMTPRYLPLPREPGLTHPRKGTITKGIAGAESMIDATDSRGGR